MQKALQSWKDGRGDEKKRIHPTERQKPEKTQKLKIYNKGERRLIKAGRIYIDKGSYCMIPKITVPIAEILRKMNNAMFAHRKVFTIVRPISCPAYFAAIDDEKKAYSIVMHGQIISPAKPHELCQNRLVYLTGDCMNCTFKPLHGTVNLGLNGLAKLIEADVKRGERVDWSFENVNSNRIVRITQRKSDNKKIMKRQGTLDEY